MYCLRRRAGRALARTLAAGLLAANMFAALPAAASADGYDLSAPAAVGKVLPNDWHISPAGSQVTLGNLPTNGVLSPDGRYLAVTNNGCTTKTEEVSIVDLKTGAKVSSAQVNSSFIGLAFNKTGDRLYVSGGNDGKIYIFSFQGGTLTTAGAVPVPNYPAGLALLPDGKLAVAENMGDKIALVDPGAGKITAEIPVGRYPYQVTVSRDGKVIYVSNWGSGSVSVVDPAKKTESRQIATGKLPEALVLSADGGRLYVANTNSDNVSVIDPAAGKVVRSIDLHFKGLPAGAAPTGLALSPDGGRLYVSLAGANADAVVDPASGKVAGYIPAGWYPTGVLYNAVLNQVITLNGKGLGTGPNPDGPKPGTNAPNQSQYDYNMITI
ncbi:beta-propeller fold lactonase family protein [Desulfotomaculum copahuensis]|uniref:YVTN family beta-propeller repeat protein n=1 Tax=Desulfotomaculum copahuensis TaxID=1838280 RepID=UPI0013735289|nr:beta-propeller fold lactonase family protein [Desulfotomaculum copahuensis]